MSKFLEAFNQLDPQKKKWASIAAAISVVLFVVFVLSSMTDNAKSERRGKQTIGAVLTDNDPRQVGLDSINSTQADQGRKITELDRNVKTLLGQGQTQSEIRDQLKELTTNVSTMSEQVKSAQDQASSLQQANKELAQRVEELTRKGLATPKVEEENLKKQAEAEAAAKARKKYEGVVNSPNTNQTEFFANAPAPVQEITKPGQATRKEEKKDILVIGEEAPEEDEDAVKDQETYLPAGSIMSGALITGIDAPTGQGAKKEPFPVLLRVKKEAVLPNRFRADIRECFLIAAAFGDLSSERAYMRAETISCIREDGAVIESGLDAYAAGEDGKAGVRGRLISKQGAILARSLMAGFMQGVSEAFNVRQVPSINVTGSGTGSNSTDIAPVYEQAFNADSMQGAAVGGAGRALERIADFYLEMAENLYPVIEIDAAREIDFIVKKGVLLKLQAAAAK
ncbi:TraB/VirB10 family protein [Pseudomonas aeruginosa]|jgi:conjugal transfer pilus assembly protein TraB|uniref:TraB/VirB10 family protein n=1 Tax=Pseudomonas aeruginosa TaxID=287 RepID=UPI001AD99ECF|nr:TraB/VirB10 family protein [Pseudomonas aeruginosa]MBO8337287.1 TraB/VirB10 family protein [Pseudomonas aeruginosa]HCF4079492.1 TraB/VirB10 family protein [Pseudomonas aeruginosa]HDV6122857.1 TraB/VirB10 family protein [Pseudomonas aeruginosa]HDV6143735.1 TraB/VirB10 family protein [Pseudomonas aeruginosa]HDV6167195.1 TraB/VirB10 family protein [Pseudomonas aeruginosa]